MVRKVNLREFSSAAALDGNKVLPAMGFVDAVKLIPAARNFSTWNNYAMYIKGITILIGDTEDGSWDMYEFNCDPKTASDLWEENGGDALQFGYYPPGIARINDTVTLHYDDDPDGRRDKDVYIRVSNAIGIADLLYTILPYFK